MRPSHNWPSQQAGYYHPATLAIGGNEADYAMEPASQAELEALRAGYSHIHDSINHLVWW